MEGEDVDRVAELAHPDSDAGAVQRRRRDQRVLLEEQDRAVGADPLGESGDEVVVGLLLGGRVSVAADPVDEPVGSQQRHLAGRRSGGAGQVAGNGCADVGHVRRAIAEGPKARGSWLACDHVERGVGLGRARRLARRVDEEAGAGERVGASRSSRQPQRIVGGGERSDRIVVEDRQRGLGDGPEAGRRGRAGRGREERNLQRLGNGVGAVIGDRHRERHARLAHAEVKLALHGGEVIGGGRAGRPAAIERRVRRGVVAIPGGDVANLCREQ